MSCVAAATRFRLLDGHVGWDPDDQITCGVSGVYDTRGLRLTDPYEPQVPSDLLTPYMPPPHLTPGCRPCEWYAISCESSQVEAPPYSCEPLVERPHILFRGLCSRDWRDILPKLMSSHLATKPVAVAVHHRRLAILDRGSKHRAAKVLIWSLPTGRLAGLVELPDDATPIDLAFTSWCELAVSTTNTDPQVMEAYARKHFALVKQTISHPESAGTNETQYLLGFDLTAKVTSLLAINAERLRRLATARDGSLWAAASQEEAGPFHLLRISPARWREDFVSPVGCGAQDTFLVQRITAPPSEHKPLDLLQEGLRDTGLLGVSDQGFCMEGPDETGALAKQCFTCAGQPTSEIVALPPSTDTEPTRLGQLLTLPIDSSIPRCRWHRIRIEADIPPDTSLQIAISTQEEELAENIESCPLAPVDFQNFPSGGPHPDDWHEAVANATDLLIDQPPGRYLYVRIRLRGTPTASPLIRRVRLDFPRITSLELLPAVYREDPDAEDFTERFLSLFDAAIEDVDRVIERLPALFDVDHVPAEVLPWLATFLGMAFQPDWDVEKRRNLLRAAPELYRRRGTPAGLAQTIGLIFGEHPALREHALGRAWGSIVSRRSNTQANTSRLGAVRLFGKSQARFRVGRSTLGSAPVRSFGKPDHDPVRADAHRFSVLMPRGTMSEASQEQLSQLITYQKPAHTMGSLRFGGQGLTVGRNSSVGVDTQLVPTAAPVLGSSGNVYLSRSAILRPGPRGHSCGLRIGVASAIGIHTVLE